MYNVLRIYPPTSRQTPLGLISKHPVPLYEPVDVLHLEEAFVADSREWDVAHHLTVYPVVTDIEIFPYLTLAHVYLSKRYRRTCVSFHVVSLL